MAFMAKLRSTVRKAPPKIADILKIVNLAPSNAVFTDYDSVLSEALETEALGSFSELRAGYDLPDGYEYDDDDEWNFIVDPISRDDYEYERQCLYGRYHIFALERCLLNRSLGFVEHVAVPVRDGVVQEMFDIYTMTSYNPVAFEDFPGAIVHDRNVVEDIYARAERNAINRYRGAVRLHQRTYDLLCYLEAFRKAGRRSIFPPEERLALFAIDDVKIEDGKIIFVTDGFTEAFNGADIDRLRLCENEKCGKVFWLKRLPKRGWIGKIGCSKRCCGALRTRQWREKTTEDQRLKYKINRVTKELKQEVGG